MHGFLTLCNGQADELELVRDGLWTERRVRHAPFVGEGGLQGIVSIGDVVKIRIDELETERTASTDYITGSR